VGGYDLSLIGSHGAVYLSVGRSVGRNQSVSKQSVRRKKRMYSGKSVSVSVGTISRAVTCRRGTSVARSLKLLALPYLPESIEQHYTIYEP
jgi:hypothetical protein